MKKYLQTKINEIADLIASAKKSILEQVTEGKFHSLKELSERIRLLEERRNEFTKDIVKNLTVDEVIEIAERKNYDGDIISPFRKQDLEYNYKYSTKVFIYDRDKLVAKFGYSFKDIPVK